MKRIMEFKFGERIYARIPIDSFEQFEKMLKYITKSVKEEFDKDKVE